MASIELSIVPYLPLFFLNTDGSKGAQIGVAVLGLTYSVDSADDYALTIHGNVSIPDMSELATEKVVSTKSKTDSALQYTANR